ncbi:MAG: GNAT family N-acetyltransferase [Gammaproteobacteria bacterium]|nr:GNAT family N-acetyltransferase [Gammaproteobacteria bacterium]
MTKVSATPFKYVIERLDKKHLKAEFSCGENALDHYLKTQANQDMKKDVAITYVLTHPDAAQILGFYTISSIGIFLEGLPAELAKKLPRYPVLPGILLGRLAVDQQHQGCKIGASLLVDALKRCLVVSQQIGITAVIVEAKDETAICFYKHFGFISFPENSHRLFLPLSTIKELGL